MHEPSVLDYLRSKLLFWKSDNAVRIVSKEDGEEDYADNSKSERYTGKERTRRSKSVLHPNWLLLLTILLGINAQRLLEPPERNILVAIILYCFAGALLVFTLKTGRWHSVHLPFSSFTKSSSQINVVYLILGSSLGLLAFVLFSSEEFTLFNSIVWIAAIGVLVKAFWQHEGGINVLQRLKNKLNDFSRQGIKLSMWGVLLGIASILIIWFRFSQLSTLPNEMFSDHAEKLYDVMDILNGKTSIFFTRNTGREGGQIYLTAFAAKQLGFGISFMSLKVGTALAGLLTLPFIYLIGLEVGQKRVALFATVFAGIAYWPNVISRVGLRFAMYPLFAAPLIYFLLRGFRKRSINSFILAGIVLGLGVQGYSAFRLMPFVVLLAGLVYVLHDRRRETITQTGKYIAITGLFSILGALPLLRYGIAHPEQIMFRTLTRISGVETSVNGSPLLIFFDNLWNALIMPFNNNGNIWVHSVPLRPALDIISASIFFIGLIIIGYRWTKNRQWQDVFLLSAIPVLMLPSAFSIAFPAENPSLNRTAGAYVIVFIIIGTAIDSLIASIRVNDRTSRGRYFGWVLAIMLVFFSSLLNYNLVFKDYKDQYNRNTWNTSEMGGLIKQFADTVGDLDNAWVVPYPHWVDTRLVGINAGNPSKDYAMWREDIPQTIEIPETKMFLFKPEDVETEEALRSIYPQGIQTLQVSDIDGKDFYSFVILPEPDGE